MPYIDIGRRVTSVDLLRGLVMLLMALDHVRDFWSIAPFSPTDLSQSTPAYFFTRWITHFCAPVFVFLSGLSVWLHRQNYKLSAPRLSGFLITRGLWLIFIEITLISFVWQFSFQLLILQVIWAIGCSMLVLALLVFLPSTLAGFFGLALIMFHNTLDGVIVDTPNWLAGLWSILHVMSTLPIQFTSFNGIAVVYPLIPWIGVMALGYSLGPLFELPAHRRDRRLRWIGCCAITMFVLLRGFNLYGDPGLSSADAPWNAHGRNALYAFMSFLNTSKYPPSLLYLLMTLGPALLLVPLLERWRGTGAKVVTVFGRVPFLFYILHLYLIHFSANLWLGLEYGVWNIAPFDPSTWPPGLQPNLTRAYLVWVITCWLLYWPCRAFMRLRQRSNKAWLSYL